MLTLLSPAKKLDFESETMRNDFTQPVLLDQAVVLAEQAKRLTTQDLKGLMGISDNLAELNVARFKAFTPPFTLANAKQAIDAFKGDVYQGLDVETLTQDDVGFAQDSVRILSGLYGLLRPLDLMQPYRLEMGIKFSSEQGSNLYQFWDTKITDQLNNELSSDKDPVVINLASNEYFKSVKKKELKARIITPVFKEIKGDNPPKIISFFAKKARGLMARYIVEEKLTAPEGLKDFTSAGYGFDPQASSDNEWVFSRQI